MPRTTRCVMTVGVIGLTTALALQAQQPGRGGAGRGGRGGAALPEGAGRGLVEANCAACHPASTIAGAVGYDRTGWRDLIHTMIRLPDDQMTIVTEYLATHFPPRPGREPKLVPGPVTVTFREWMPPTLGQRPRDPFQLPDGTIWWAGMYGSIIGRLNPATGEFREYQLPDGARPHSVTADRQGRVWYTGNNNGTIGRLDPLTGDITVFPTRDPGATDPHTLIFDKAGILWFTMQQGNRVGRFDPATGDMKIVLMPTPNARPYDIRIDSKGAPWVCYNGSNKIATIDPATLAVREFATATPATRIRRLALLRDDTVFYVDSSRGYLGRLDPKTGTFTEWLSPSGPSSYPYALEVIDNIVWYNESNQRPDTLVRFDPKTARFQSWAIPSGVGIIRHMRASPDGNLVIHQSSSNRVGLAIIGGGR